MKNIKNLFFIIFSTILLAPQTTWALSETSVENFERQVEQQILRLSTVHFGTSENVAASVKAVTKKTAAPAPKETEALDVGYLPAPVAAMGSPSSEELEIDRLEISMVISSLVDEAAVRSLRTSVQRMFAPYRPNIRVQKVKFTEVIKPKPAAEATPKEQPKEIKAPDFTKKDILWAIIVPVSTFSLVMALYFAFSKLSESLRSASKNLAAEGILIRGSEPKGQLAQNLKEAETDPKRVETLVNEKINPKDFLESLKKLADQEPVRFISVLSDSPSDMLGLRWFLSQLPTETAERLNKFLGQERLRKIMTPMLAPANFSMGAWAQDLNERATLKHLAGRDFLESIFSGDDLSFLYQLETDHIFQLASKENNIAYWKVLAELASSDYLLKKSTELETTQWAQIIRSSKVTLDQAKDNSERLIAALKSNYSKPELHQVIDVGFEDKISEPLLQKLQILPFGEDEVFLDEIAADSPRISERLRKQFWTFRDLRELDIASLKYFIDAQTNETLFSLLYVASEKDRELFKSHIPEGMRKSVVLDLLQQALARADEAKLKAAISLTRETLQKTMKLYEAGKISKRSDKGLAA
ncbi:hypothetical protein AZI86_17080 [Bdellovibrio bacteriovorus]|uniref:Flagellar motor switch protein FliG C-terminal domain-containing protein n=1 Tax=Bdellovibrio bacteriovorus TaxID=959 RepID=A0A150WE96_BDEBC|nr:FliG C-terminal domain-containing protein [Bdellovibrio bacteriovorus]KYG61427.1 hypothetical protein AZI86_17080 [Bdellovibrio bacteriovorus]